MRDQPPDSTGDDRDLGGPGWEREHGADTSDFLDSVFDPDDPFHAEALKSYNEQLAQQADKKDVEDV